jgi:hypothetical protein
VGYFNKEARIIPKVKYNIWTELYREDHARSQGYLNASKINICTLITWTVIFTITMADGKCITHKNLSDFGNDRKIRVYNTDFVKENLGWLHNEDGSIKPFTVLGAKNVELENKIKEIETKIGKEEDKTGLAFEFINRANIHAKAVKDHQYSTGDLDGKT